MLMEIARHPDATMRDIAAAIGITERAVHGIITDLHQAGYLSRERVGRRNHYRINPDQHLRYPTEAAFPVGRLIEVFVDHDLAEPITNTR
ncbi:MarR family transcriptional regulator [Sphaerisporangium corydalis]|uniref:MarR family transcriptional regulator n=1 Tax=Sphaerisporangium corydalis TaxID=1441875 RepID=A0ABV9EMJ8_9ACTN|nr:helix-turn-helix domain-containing protein [Sphaerisporangium corydalis]